MATSWNPAAEALFGYRAQEMLGHPLARLFPADKLMEELALLERLRQGETIEPFETERLNKQEIPQDGDWFPLLDKNTRRRGSNDPRKTARELERNEHTEQDNMKRPDSTNAPDHKNKRLTRCAQLSKIGKSDHEPRQDEEEIDK